MKKGLLRIIALCLVAALALPLPAFATEAGSDWTDPEQQVSEETTAAPEDGTEPEATLPAEEEPAEESTEPVTEITEPVTEATEPAAESTEPPQEETETAEVEAQTEPAMLAEETEEPKEDFSCFTYDGNGEKLNGYCAEDGSWYLFLTSTQSVADTVVYYTGSVTEASAGELNAEAGTVSGAFTASGDKLTLTGADDSAYTVTVMQSKLPSVYITLNGTTLAEVHKDKDAKYAGNSISIMDPEGKYDLKVENSVEFKGRGNSTWMFFDKKGYQIKFDSKTSVLGMGKAKKWILLANAADETLMHNMLALELAAQMDMEYVTDFEYVDLWIDGEYRGNYILGEKAEIGSSRLDLQDDYGTLFEQDQGFYYEEDYNFLCRAMRKYFVVKETNADDSNEAEMQKVMDAFNKDLNTLALYLYSTDPEEVTLEKLNQMIDVDTAAKYYLINEYTCNAESTAGSFYWYKDGLEDIPHIGPVWDFDSSMGNEKNEVQYYMKSHVLFDCLLAVPEFYDRTVEIYNQYKSAFDAMASRAEFFKTRIGDSAAMNFTRWNVWGKANPKNTLKDYSASYEEGFGKLTSWLTARAGSFQVQRGYRAFTKVSEDCTTLEIYYKSDLDCSRMEFSLWSDNIATGENKAQADLKNYKAEKNADGLWYAKVDLSNHQTAGKYTMSVFATVDGNRVNVATGYAFVEKVNSPAISAELAKDGQSIDVSLSSVGKYTDVSIKVWCETEGEAKPVEYTPKKQSDNTLTCTVDLADHKLTGVYHIEAYGKKNGKSVLIAETTVDAKDATWPVLTAKLNQEDYTMEISLDNVGSYSYITFEVWGLKDGDKDAAGYSPVQQENGSWTVTVSALNHYEAGAYHVDAYGTRNGVKTLIASLETEAFEQTQDVVYRLYNPYTLEHLLTASEEEKDALVKAGWSLDGIAWNAPVPGIPVYRLYNRYDDWHTYSTSAEEIASMTSEGWEVDGVAFYSASDEDSTPVYRLFNPYEQRNYHLLTSSEEEVNFLTSLGWKIDGVVMYVN